MILKEVLMEVSIQMHYTEVIFTKNTICIPQEKF